MKRIIKNSKDKVNAGIDGWDNRTGVIKRIDKYLYDNPEAIPPKGYIQPGSRAYDDAVSRYGDYVTTPFGNISTDDLMQYARDNKLLNDKRLSTIDASVTFSNFVLDSKGKLHSTSDLLKGYSLTRDTSFICPRDEHSLVEIYSDTDGQHVLQCVHCQTQYAYEDDDLESFQEI